MFSDTLISPKSDQSIRNKYLDLKRKTGSPNFRDILRQRCRERVKARRNHLFDRLRSFQNEESVRDAISQFIEMDLEEIKSPKPLSSSIRIEDDSMDVIEDAPLSQLAMTEEEKWILEEYDRMIENTNAQAELADMVTCPICTRGVLKVDEGKQAIVCSLCSLLLPHTMTLPEVEQRIIQAVKSHGQDCMAEPQFIICPEDHTSNLLLLCYECPQCHQIV